MKIHTNKILGLKKEKQPFPGKMHKPSQILLKARKVIKMLF